MTVAGCDPARNRRLGLARFTNVVRKEMRRRGGHRVTHRVNRALHAAAGDPRGVPAQRLGGLERAAFALADLDHARAQRDQVEALLISILDQLALTELVTTIPGLSEAGAAAILAETGDLTRFDSARALVKHAALCPRENASDTYAGKTTISGRGRPLLRVATWRAVWGALPNNPVLAARHRHLTTRTHNPLCDAQARVAVGGSLLRQLCVVVTTGPPGTPRSPAGTAAPRK